MFGKFVVMYDFGIKIYENYDIYLYLLLYGLRGREEEWKKIKNCKFRSDEVLCWSL